MKSAIMRVSQLSCTKIEYVSLESFLCVLDTDYAHILCLLAFSVCNIHGWTKRSIKKKFFLVQGVQKLVAERWTI